MAIIINQEKRIFTLHTKHTTYQMMAEPHGVLLHLYYGARIAGTDMDYLVKGYDRGFSGNPYDAGYDRTFSTDTLPQEYPGSGEGDYRIDCLRLTNADGSFSGDYRYEGYRLESEKYEIPGLPSAYGTGIQTLAVDLKDQVTGVLVSLYYAVFEEEDVITRAVTITNTSHQEIVLTKAQSVCLDLPFGEWELLHFHGRHSMERQAERLSLPHGIVEIASTRGTSSHHHNPFVILCEKDATEDAGECMSMSLVYSGSFSAKAEVDQIGQTRLVMGVHEDQFSWRLGSGESFAAPEAVLAYSDQGLTGLSLQLHRFVREHICRGKYKNARRPILINNWEATYFDFNSDKLVEIARESAKLGVEMLVMDDGWFGNRQDDCRGLGDWFVNEDKVVGGIRALAERVNAEGLKFGIWVEPEMVSEDSELFRRHPDWALSIPGRKPVRSRYQLVLDLSRKDVTDYLFERLTAILDSANIEYVKWDMNRSLANVYSQALPKERQGEVQYRYMLGLYSLLDRLTKRYPNLLLEGCSGGGGRFDLGMLAYSPQIWCSDDTDAIERLQIQYGTSFGYPVSAVGSHVSASPNHQTGRETPFATRGVVAMSGSFGYELDPGKLTEEEREQVKRQIADFKEYYEVIQWGDYYRLTSPAENRHITAWQFVSPDQKESLLNAVVTHVQANDAPIHLKLKGLNPDWSYLVEGRTGSFKEALTVSGAALMKAGLNLGVAMGHYPAYQVKLTVR